MVLIKRSGIDKQVREETERRRQDRRQMDIMTGLTKTSGPMRTDFKLCRENDKLYKDYRRFTNRSDREKIKVQLEQTRKEFRHGT